MKEIRYDDASHHTLRIGEQEVQGGQSATVSDEEAEDLLTAPYVNCSLVRDDVPSGESASDDALSAPTGETAE